MSHTAHVRKQNGNECIDTIQNAAVDKVVYIVQFFFHFHYVSSSIRIYKTAVVKLCVQTSTYFCNPHLSHSTVRRICYR